MKSKLTKAKATAKIAMGKVKSVVATTITMHLSSKTPTDEALSPYPLECQSHQVFYQKDANGYWSFIQCVG